MGREFVIETWKPGWVDGTGLLDSLLVGLWSVLSPGYRINVKPLPVRFGHAIHRERARSQHEAERRVDEIAEALRSTGRIAAS